MTTRETIAQFAQRAGWKAVSFAHRDSYVRRGYEIRIGWDGDTIECADYYGPTSNVRCRTADKTSVFDWMMTR